MAKSVKSPAKQADPFVPPETWVGQRVYWHHGLGNVGTIPVLAIVTECCANSRVRLAVLNVDNAHFSVHDDPIPHKSDPAARRFTESEPDAGTWEECPTELKPSEVALLRQILAAAPAPELESQAG